MRYKPRNELSQNWSRLRIRFGVRSLIIGTTLICLVLGLFLQTVLRYNQRRKQARSLIESVGGKIKLKGISLDGPPGKNWLTRQTGISKWAEQLWSVDLSGTSIDGKQVAKLSGCDWIRKLDLSNTKLTDDDLGFLSGLPKIRELNLSDTAITDAGLQPVKNLQRLLAFETKNTGVTWEGLTDLDNSFVEPRAFADLSIVSELRRDGISVQCRREITVPNPDEMNMQEAYDSYARMVHLTDATRLNASVLEEIRKLSRLRSFSASFGKRRFSKPEIIRDWQKLRSLRIGGGQLDDEDFRHIASLTNLRYLFLEGHHEVSDGAVLMLGENSSLEWLALNGTNNTLEITKYLGGLKGLRRLSLSAWVSRGKDQPLDPDQRRASLESLQRLECLPKLETLLLNGNGFSDEAILALAKFPNLKRIVLSDDYLKPETVALLQKRLPNCTVGSSRQGIYYSQNLD